MKYLALVLSSLFLASNLFAGSTGLRGGRKLNIWRSTRMVHARSFAALSSSTMRNVHIYAVIIESPTVNTDTYLTIYNSTTGSAGITFNPNVTTAAFIPTVSKTLAEIPKNQFVYVGVNLSSGAVFNKIGTAPIRVLWDFIDSRLVDYVPYTP